MISVIILALLTTSASGLASFFLLRALRRHAVLDIPNARSSHQTPTPRGGGLAIFLVFAPIFLIFLSLSQSMLIVFAHGFALLALLCISFLDDKIGISWRLRLFVQALAVTAGLYAFGDVSFFGLPFIVERAALFMFWLWIINLTNFIDGIDGITGMNILILTFGIALFGVFFPLPLTLSLYALLMGCAVLGFMPFNWHKAKMFLGDVGSVPLGYMAGFFILSTLQTDAWSLGLLLYLYPVMDATLTLIKRALKFKKLTEAHRDHAYQAAVDKGGDHDVVVWHIAGLGGVCFALSVGGAFFGVLGQSFALLIGALATYALTRYFRKA